MDGEHLLSEDHDLEDLRDEELVALFVAKRDEEVFNELVNRYGDRVYRLAYRLTGDPKDARRFYRRSLSYSPKSCRPSGARRSSRRGSTGLRRTRPTCTSGTPPVTGTRT